MSNARNLLTELAYTDPEELAQLADEYGEAAREEESRSTAYVLRRYEQALRELISAAEVRAVQVQH